MRMAALPGHVAVRRSTSRLFKRGSDSDPDRSSGDLNSKLGCFDDMELVKEAPALGELGEAFMVEVELD